MTYLDEHGKVLGAETDVFPYCSLMKARGPKPPLGYETLDIAKTLPSVGPCRHVDVVEEDTFVAALGIGGGIDGGCAVLDMASAVHPGGGYLTGAGAQEEDLCRRSTLVPWLLAAKRRRWYPLPPTGVLFVSNVAVLRGPRPEYDWLPWYVTNKTGSEKEQV